MARAALFLSSRLRPCTVVRGANVVASDRPSRRGPPEAGDPKGPSSLSELDSQSDSDAAEYSVGKGRPPRHSQFKAGNAGGPGRPKGSKNRATLFEEAFDKPREVTIEGRKRKMTAQQLGYQQLSIKVAKGELKALCRTVQAALNLLGRGS